MQENKNTYYTSEINSPQCAQCVWGALSVWGKNLGKIQCVMKSAYIYHADSDWMMHDDDINCSKNGTSV